MIVYVNDLLNKLKCFTCINFGKTKKHKNSSIKCRKMAEIN